MFTLCRRLGLSSFCTGKPANLGQDTIFALASGHARSPVSIIRVSGASAYLALKLLSQKKEYSVDNRDEMIETLKIKHRYAHLRSLYTHDRRLIDQGIVIFYPHTSSFNGEDIIELQVHGGRSIIKLLFEELRKLGFRMAEKGQFTKRAILNNKMDLLQAEGISQLIMSDSEFGRKVALGHLLGETSQQVQKIKTELVSCLAACEAFIDFPDQEEDIRQDLFDKTKVRAEGILKQLKKALAQRKQMQMMSEGVKVTILGKPNVGKSTILNKLVKRQVAIVSDIPGTTRDLIQSSIEHKGVVISLTDTAGIRDTTEKIEKQGIARALRNIENSHLVVYVVDPSLELIEKSDRGLVIEVNGQIDERIILNPKTVVMVNKSDTNKDLKVPIFVKTQNGSIKNCSLLLSALKDQQIEILLDEIIKSANQLYRFEQFQNQMLLTKQRHFEAIKSAVQHLNKFCYQELPVDVSCEELREAIVDIGSITGRVDVEQMLDVLFRDFCIGK